MKTSCMKCLAPIMASALILWGYALSAQEKGGAGPAQVHVVITDVGLKADAELPRLRQDEVKVKQGKTFLQVTQLISAQGDNAALQLMILIDDTLDKTSPTFGNSLMPNPRQR